MFEDIVIRHHKINNKSSLAIFTYIGQGDPVSNLKDVIYDYTRGKSYNEFIDSHLDNPWIKVIIIGINDLPQKRYNETNRNLW